MNFFFDRPYFLINSDYRCYDELDENSHLVEQVHLHYLLRNVKTGTKFISYDHPIWKVFRVNGSGFLPVANAGSLKSAIFMTIGGLK